MKNLPKEFERKWVVPAGSTETLRYKIMNIDNLGTYVFGGGTDTFYKGATKKSFIRIRESDRNTYGASICSKNRLSADLTVREEKEIHISPFIETKDFREFLEIAGFSPVGKILKRNFCNYFFPDAVLTTYEVTDLMNGNASKVIFEIEIKDIVGLAKKEKLQLLNSYVSRLDSPYVRENNFVNKSLFDMYSKVAAIPTHSLDPA